MSEDETRNEIPALSRLVVSFFVPRRSRSEILGDLAEQFEYSRLSWGVRAARRAYRRQALCIVVQYTIAYGIEIIEAIIKASAFLYRILHWWEKFLELLRPFVEFIKELLRW